MSHDSTTSSRVRSSPRSSDNGAREQHRQYSFTRRSRGHQARRVTHAVETLFKVTVEDVRTSIVRGKIKRVGK